MDNQTYQNDDVIGQPGPSGAKGMTSEPTGEEALLITGSAHFIMM